MTDNPLPNLIPEQLLADLNKGECVLFLGIDFPILSGGETPPGRAAFTARLTEKLLEDKDFARLAESESNPWKIAEYYETAFNRQALIQELKDWVSESSPEPLPIHHSIARLPLEAVITTACDDRLEQALRMAGKEPVKVVTDLDIPFVGSNKVLVLKLLGDLDQPLSLVLTDSDQRKLKGRLAPLLSVVRYLFVIKTLLFVGYDLEDDLFRDMMAEVQHGVHDLQRLSYAVRPGAEPLERRLWENKGMRLIDSPPAQFIQQLEKRLVVKDDPVEPKKSTALLNRRPYLFLNPYGPDDIEVFFGRETESLLLWRKILSYRLVVLFGASGTGKSSLLHAGVLPRLRQYGYRIASARVENDPSRAVRQSVMEIMNPPGEKLPPLAQETLGDYFQRALEPKDRLVVFLDQFEELFVNLNGEAQIAFLNEVAACMRDENREVRFVLSLREDFLPRLEAHRDHLLQHYANSFCLHPLGAAAAELAVTEPAFRVGLAYEPALIQRLLKDLQEGGSVAPPQLQIVCDRLYDAALDAAQTGKPAKLLKSLKTIFSLGKPAQTAQAAITVEQYQQLGGAQTILADYVDEVIARLPKAQQVARMVLKAMITHEGTKAVLGETEIAARARLEADTVSGILKNLTDFRLLRRLKGDASASLYELAHEHMIAKILSWISPQELDAQIARRLLDQQVARFREFGGLIDVDTFKRIDAQRDNPYLEIASQVELELLLRSALTAGVEAAYWCERTAAGEVDVRAIIEEGLKSENFRIRAASVTVVGRIANPTYLYLPALCEMLSDLYPQVRAAAIHALEKLQPTGEWREHLKYECYVPAGEFIMGDDKSDVKNERPAHKVYLDAYYIAKYPTTNAEYLRYKHDIRQHFEMPVGQENHPVDSVIWYDARDYAGWADMRLLSEAQWEKAASWESSPSLAGKGAGGIGRKRVYPWGDEFDKEKCNTSEKSAASEFYTTTPVGKYSPQGDSPYGVADMAGNVWEWCSSLEKDYPYQVDDGREDLTTSAAHRAMRGGSWRDSHIYSRCAPRNCNLPDVRDAVIGFRVGCLPSMGS